MTVVGDELKVQARSAEPVASAGRRGDLFRGRRRSRRAYLRRVCPGLQAAALASSPVVACDGPDSSSSGRDAHARAGAGPDRPRRVAVRRDARKGGARRAGPPRRPAAPGPKIVEIVVRGGKTVTAETVGFYLGVRPGDHLRPGDPPPQLRPPLGLGPLRDLRLEQEPAAGGVNVVAVVVERPTVADLEFRGNKKLTTSHSRTS